MKRTRHMIGDCYSARLNDYTKRYFQYVANDITQLNSDVVRVFEGVYAIDATPELSAVTGSRVDFYAHVVIPIGVKLGVWEKVGHVAEVGALDVTFRHTDDYGGKRGEVPVKVSQSWYVWKVNEDFQHVGRLEGKYGNAFVGLVFSPNGFLELLKGNRYPPNYPE